MCSCREIISGYIKKHAQKTLANKQMKYFFLWSKYSLSSTKKLFLWLSRNLFLLPKYNKAAESVFLTKYCALRNVISFFIAKYITMTNLVLIFHVKVLKNLNISLLLDLNLKVKKNLNIPLLLDLNLNISLLLDLKAPILLLLISSQLSYIFPMAYIYNNRWQIR